MRWTSVSRCLIVAILLALFAAPSMANENGTAPRRTAKSLKRSELMKVSRGIDRLVEDQLRDRNDSRNPLASDEIFVRRIYLDIAGRIPTLEETTRFLNSDAGNKRAELIDELLDSYGYVSRQFNFWADILRLKTRLRNVQGQSYINYVKDSIADNKPYDVFVREMLASSGPMVAENNGQVGYYLRDIGMPEDNMSNTIRIFLGTRLECAQCHDHPFDKWTQRQYFEMVAFTGGMSYRVGNGNVYGKLRNFAKERGDEITQEHRRVIQRLVQPLMTGVSGSGTGLAVLPEGFMGDDGEEGDIVTGKTMFEGKPLVDAKVPEYRDRKGRKRKPRKIRNQNIPGAQPVNSREAYADWLTDRDNPRFATVIANRLWKQAMGMGLVEPVDMFDDGTEASNPALMEFLGDSMIDLDFDMKQFLRAIYNSRTYQSVAVGTDIPDPKKFNFNGPVVRRMSAEQLWDSMLTLAVDDVDQRYQPQAYPVSHLFGADNINEALEKLQTMSGRELFDVVDDIVQDGGLNKMQQAARRKDQRQRNKLSAQLRTINKELTRAKKARDREKIKELMVEKTTLMAQYKKKRSGGGYRRASELPSPAPPGHFLREFGQSDRDQIENSNTDPAVTQVLSLMNGFVESQISSNQNTVLMTNMIKPDRLTDKVEAAYLTMLARKPKSHELSMWRRDFEDLGYQAASDLIWVLANSNEFIFVK